MAHACRSPCGVTRFTDAQGRNVLAQRLAHARYEIVGVPLQHGEIELKLGRKVLVENGFAHTRTVGDLVHARGVVAAVNENLAGSSE